METQLIVSQWFCAVTNPNCQARASLELRAGGYVAFYPKARRWVHHARTKIAKDKPLLGRYIFVQMPKEHAGIVRWVNGIASLVAVAGDPIAIPDSAVLDFRARYLSGEWDETKGKLPLGARVEITQGAFESYLGVLTSRSRGKHSVRVIRDPQGNRVRNTVAELHRHAIAAA